MNLCPVCGSSLPERAIFCPVCAAQARCKVCRDMLELNARACVSCGTLLGDGKTSIASDQPPSSSDAINVLHFQEDKVGRVLNFRFTDTAMATVGETLVYALDRRLAPRDVRFPHRGAQHTMDTQLLPAPEEESAGSAPKSNSDQRVSPPQTSGTDKELLREVFHQVGATLQLDEPRLKADSKLDYARRLAFLFLYAHEQEGRPQVARADLNVILQKVNDPNTQTFLRTHPGFERDGELFRLNRKGRDEAKDALKKISDTSATDSGWMPGIAKQGKDDSDSKSSAGSSGKRGRKASAKPKEWAQKWKLAHPSIEVHSLLEKRSNPDKGIFALWAISKVAGDEGKVVSEGLISKFLLEAFIFKIEHRSLARSLKADSAKGKVLKVQGGFQLQPPGTKWAQDLAAGKNV
jgi:hypothetical protein